MKDKNLVNAIRRLKVETRSLACMGCGHEHNCGVSGCAVMREAADRIANQSTHIAVLQMEIEKLRGRLMQYEDTELTPEEIDMDHEAAEQLRQLCRGYDLGRLVNLAEADKAGRVVVRPYKIDAAVYVLVKDEAIFYGCEMETLIGQAFTSDVKHSEAVRYIREALMVNPYIRAVRQMSVDFKDSRLTVSCTVDTIYGEVDVYV